MAGATVVAVGAGGYGFWSIAADAGPSYRTAVVGRGDLAETLDLSGTLNSAGMRDLGFVTAGTVARVLVEQGDRVRAGQVIARLDDQDLRTTLAAARADLAAARAQLEADQDAQAETVSAAATTSSSSASSTPSTDMPNGSSDSTPTDTTTSTEDAEPLEESDETTDPSTPTSPSTPSTLAALEDLAEQQDAVTSAQSAASAALADASAALDAQTAACADAFTAPAVETDAGDPGETDEAGETEEQTGTGGTAADTAANEACTQALAQVEQAQEQVSQAQGDLQDALVTLGATLTSAWDELRNTLETGEPSDTEEPDTEQTDPTEDAPQEPTAEPTTPTTPTSPTSPSSADDETSATTPSSGTTEVTAATLADDQAAIDTARAALISARDAWEGSVLTAPTGGTIASLDLEAGDDVTAGGAVGVLSAGRRTTVEVDATTAQVASLETGQRASVTPAGSERSYGGAITAIAAVPTTSDSGSSIYAVTVTLARAGLDLPEGTGASVEVTLSQVEDALVVPASAVSSGSVTVLDATGTATPTPVTTGVVGASAVEIVDGLEEGDEVVLADLGADLPTGDSDTQTDLGGPGGGGMPSGMPMGNGGPPSFG